MSVAAAFRRGAGGVRGAKFFDRRGGRLVYVQEAPTAGFWDARWLGVAERDHRAVAPRRGTFVTRTTLRHLPRGARILEGYPVEPGKGPMPDVFVYTGIASAFRAAGFEEAARRSKTRPIMRLDLAPAPGRRVLSGAGAGRRGRSRTRGRGPRAGPSRRRSRTTAPCGSS